MERLQGELRELGAGIRGHIRLRCNTSAIAEHLPRELGDYLRENPTVSVDIEERPSTSIADALREQSCDIGVLSDAADTHGLEVFPLRPDPLVL
ncbi:LysR substrate-binding domain-containing protein, partial [Streptococcus pyogenes]|uniref:LysR substrate-binding domain-containing protein n=1 Tax=Streptococcus pyogenes TaxID=1314 RepID=UPI003DA1087A